MNTKIKNAFIKVMEDNEIDNSYYSFDGYKEGAVCVVKDSVVKYKVFDAERARRYNERSFPNFKDTCLEVIFRITDSNEDYIFLSNLFSEKIGEDIIR